MGPCPSAGGAGAFAVATHDVAWQSADGAQSAGVLQLSSLKIGFDGAQLDEAGVESAGAEVGGTGLVAEGVEVQPIQTHKPRHAHSPIEEEALITVSVVTKDRPSHAAMHSKALKALLGEEFAS